MQLSFLERTMENFADTYGIPNYKLEEFCAVIRDAVIEVALHDIDTLGLTEYKKAMSKELEKYK